MANTILVIGESGTGKSTSIRNLDPAETYIINILDKPLPFRGAKKKYVLKEEGKEGGNYYSSDSKDKIIACAQGVSMKRPEIKNLIIDDYQYIMSNEFMRRAMEKGYDKFSQIGQMGWEVIQKLQLLRNDLDCFVLSHNDIGDDGRSRCKVIGKMLTDKICLEGMFTMVLHTTIVDGEYKFITNGDINCAAKTPMGLFETKLIDNDLNYVKKKYDEYLSEDIPQ